MTPSFAVCNCRLGKEKKKKARELLRILRLGGNLTEIYTNMAVLERFPGLLRIIANYYIDFFRLDNNFTVVASKTIFKCDRANLLWNCKGESLIVLYRKIIIYF